MENTGEVFRIKWSPEGRAQFGKAMAAAQREYGEIVKGNKANIKMKAGGSFGYGYASLSDDLDATMPALNKNGIAVFQAASFQYGNKSTVASIETLLLHESGEWCSYDFEMAGEVDLSDPKSSGILESYARRYAIEPFLGIASKKEDKEPGSREARNDEPDADELAEEFLRQERERASKEGQAARVAANTPHHLKARVTNGKAVEEKSAAVESETKPLSPPELLRAAFDGSLIPSRDNVSLGEWIKRNSFPTASREHPLTEANIIELIEKVQIRHDELAMITLPNDHVGYGVNVASFTAEGAENRSKLIAIVGGWLPEAQVQLAMKASGKRTNRIGEMLLNEAWVEIALELSVDDSFLVPA
jgi:hypothetical protein